MFSAWVGQKKAQRDRRGLSGYHWLGLALLAVAALWLGFKWCGGGSVPGGAAAMTSGAPAVKRNATNAPLSRLAILVFKSEKIMEVWGASDGDERWARLREYPVLASSGAAGPKLREGDRQVPEGVYELKRAAEHARTHRLLEVNYPRAFDIKKARSDGRSKLGGDIFIVGKNPAPGSVCIGEAAVEDLFGLVESVKREHIKIILAPNDLRKRIPVRNPNMKLPWLEELYGELRRELRAYGQ